jgi:hypothetical protein
VIVQFDLKVSRDEAETPDIERLEERREDRRGYEGERRAWEDRERVVVPSVEPQRTLTLDQLLDLLPRVREQDITRLIEHLEMVDPQDQRYEEREEQQRGKLAASQEERHLRLVEPTPTRTRTSAAPSHGKMYHYAHPTRREAPGVGTPQSKSGSLSEQKIPDKYQKPLQAWKQGHRSIRAMMQALPIKFNEARDLIDEMHELKLINKHDKSK